ncbi:MAG: Gfo/Idh/MocA family oxidoreductase [Pedobacter sp.]|nr:Gfo/Idh/MocA family oxidoreductase [Chitinophagaceae bacterium]
MKIAILGSGKIASLYAAALNSQRSKDYILTVYSRNISNAKRFANDFFVQEFTDNMVKAIENPNVEAVIICLPNHLHKIAVQACVAAKKPILCTKPLGRTAQEAKYLLDLVENAGIFAGYLEDLCYTPNILKSAEYIMDGRVGNITWVKSRQGNTSPSSDWLWNRAKSGGGAIIDLASNCIAIGRNLIGKQIKPVEVMCWSATQFYPIDVEDNAVGIIKYANGAINQFEVSWHSKLGKETRDDIIGTEGSFSFTNNFNEDGQSYDRNQFLLEKTTPKNYQQSFGNGFSNNIGFQNMFTDMFNAIENNRPPLETFYDGYIVNAIIDAAYLSVNSKKWEPIILDDWRGEEDKTLENLAISYNEKYYLVKEEMLPNGDLKTILKHKNSGELVEKVW